MTNCTCDAFSSATSTPTLTCTNTSNGLGLLVNPAPYCDGIYAETSTNNDNGAIHGKVSGSTLGFGIKGSCTSTASGSAGVYGISGSAAPAIRAYNYGTGPGIISNIVSSQDAIRGTTTSGVGVRGESYYSNGVIAQSTNSQALYATSAAGGIYAYTAGTSSKAIDAVATGSSAIGIYTYANSVYSGTWAGYFNGRVYVAGSLSKASGTFTIDHPLDPENKILNHSFVESPDMKNVYDGLAVANNKGECIVELPTYFEALNENFRYQFTPVGEFAPIFLADKVKNNKFKVAGLKPNQEFCWQVTGSRKDAYAKANPVVVEQDKEEKGYLNPEAFGFDNEKSCHKKIRAIKNTFKE